MGGASSQRKRPVQATSRSKREDYRHIYAYLLRAPHLFRAVDEGWVAAQRVIISGMAIDRITVDPAQMGGVPCIRGLRVTVSMVLGQLAAGRTADELLADYPYLEREDITAALEFAAAIVNEREVPIARPA